MDVEGNKDDANHDRGNLQQAYIEPFFPGYALGAESPLEADLIELLDAILPETRRSQTFVVILPVFVASGDRVIRKRKKQCY